MYYLLAEFEAAEEERVFRIYVADSINMLPQRRRFTRPYSDRYRNEPEDDRTGDEIAQDVIERLGLIL